MMRGLLIIFLAIAFIGCKPEKNNPISQITLFDGEPYTGRVKVNIEPPQTNGTSHLGSGSLHFVENGATSRLVLSGVINNEEGETGDAGFVLDGVIKHSAWTFQQQGMRFEISKDGKVSGSNITPKEEYTFNGSLSTTKFKMEVVVNMLDETDGGYPAGTIFRYNYDFSRADPNNEQPSAESGCKTIRWELRNIWNPGGGGMIMVRVPVCYD